MKKDLRTGMDGIRGEEEDLGVSVHLVHFVHSVHFVHFVHQSKVLEWT